MRDDDDDDKQEEIVEEKERKHEQNPNFHNGFLEPDRDWQKS